VLLLEFVGKRIGRSEYRKSGMLICFLLATGCWLWVIVDGPGPAILGGVLGYFSLFIIWLAGVASDK
jgi:hypothetical protein